MLGNPPYPTAPLSAAMCSSLSPCISNVETPAAPAPCAVANSIPPEEAREVIGRVFPAR